MDKIWVIKMFYFNFFCSWTLVLYGFICKWNKVPKLIVGGTIFPLKGLKTPSARTQASICADLMNKFIWKLSLMKLQMSAWSSKYLDIIF